MLLCIELSHWQTLSNFSVSRWNNSILIQFYTDQKLQTIQFNSLKMIRNYVMALPFPKPLSFFEWLFALYIFYRLFCIALSPNAVSKSLLSIVKIFNCKSSESPLLKYWHYRVELIPPIERSSPNLYFQYRCWYPWIVSSIYTFASFEFYII